MYVSPCKPIPHKINAVAVNDDNRRMKYACPNLLMVVDIHGGWAGDALFGIRRTILTRRGSHVEASAVILDGFVFYLTKLLHCEEKLVNASLLTVCLQKCVCIQCIGLFCHRRHY